MTKPVALPSTNVAKTAVTPALIDAAQVVVPCINFAELFAFFTEKLGFAVSLIYPADSPSTAVVVGHGMTVRLDGLADASMTRTPVTFRLQCESMAAVASLVIPTDIRVIFVPKYASAPTMIALSVPAGKPEFALSRAADASEATTVGRAGMIYRDLIPTRLGGRLVASLITIVEGGAVPDYVHFHRIIFQMIFCKSGWVKVVYEGQGEPFVLLAGDCVLQPPEIRHRVLEASAGLQVIELGCPAVHDTIADADLSLPTPDLNPKRSFGGQRFARHVAADAKWLVWRENGKNIHAFEATDVGIAAATNYLAAVNILRLQPGVSSGEFMTSHEGEILFFFVLAGELSVSVQATATTQAEHHVLMADDSVVIPSGASYTVRATAKTAKGSKGFSLLRVAL